MSEKYILTFGYKDKLGNRVGLDPLEGSLAECRDAQAKRTASVKADGNEIWFSHVEKKDVFEHNQKIFDSFLGCFPAKKDKPTRPA